MAGYLFILVQPDGEPNDPGVFITNEPPGVWKVGDTFIARGLERFRILDIQPAPEGENGAEWAAEYLAVWTVEPV
jgi:hypothetical protein